jgi:hypothetical protein
MDHRDVLTADLPYLLDNLTITETLLGHLLQHKIFISENKEKIEVKFEY